MKTIIKALKKHFGAKAEIEEGKYKHYGLNTFEIDGETYAVGTDSEAAEALKENITDSLWAFRASFILSYCGLDYSGEKALEEMQGKLCESANPLILSMVKGANGGLDGFVEEAEKADGRGHFLSSYDGEEIELDGGLFAFRID